MRTFTHVHSLAAVAATVLMAGCGAAGVSTQGPLGRPALGSRAAIPSRAMSPSVALPAALRAQPRHRNGALPSTLGPDVASYVYACAYSGDYCNVYNQHTAVLLNQLTASNGLSSPQGTIVGALGHWYIANTGDSNVLVFKPAGASLLRTLSDPNFFPVNVALTKQLTVVSNIFDTSFGPGNVAVYKKGSTAKPSYTLGVSGAYQGIGVATDPSGNCYWSFNSSPSSGSGEIVQFSHCAKGSTGVSIGVSLGFAGGMAFDNGGNLWYTDQLAGLYRCSGTTSCTLVVSGFGDPLMLNFNKGFKKLFIVDVTTGVDVVTDFAFGVRPNYIVTPFASIPSTDTPIGVGAAPPPAIPPF